MSQGMSRDSRDSLTLRGMPWANARVTSPSVEDGLFLLLLNEMEHSSPVNDIKLGLIF